MAMAISKRGVDFIKGYEYFVPYVYDDKVQPRRVNGKLSYLEWDGGPVKGTLTIGYGHTNAAKHPLKIKQGLRITEAEAEKILDVDLDDCERAVNRLVKVPVSQGQFDALVSLTFNMGEGNLRKSSLLAKLNRRDYAGARAAFDLYVRSGGEIMRGLQRRRDAEQAMWDARYGEARSPSAAVDHPAEVDADPGPAEVLTKSKIAQTSGGGIVLAGGDAAATAADTLEQVGRVKEGAERSGLLDYAQALLTNPRFLIAVAIIIVLACIIYWRWRDHR